MEVKVDQEKDEIRFEKISGSDNEIDGFYLDATCKEDSKVNSKQLVCRLEIELSPFPKKENYCFNLNEAKEHDARMHLLDNSTKGSKLKLVVYPIGANRLKVVGALVGRQFLINKPINSGKASTEKQEKNTKAKEVKN
jgi:hypothetical protein